MIRLVMVASHGCSIRSICVSIGVSELVTVLIVRCGALAWIHTSRQVRQLEVRVELWRYLVLELHLVVMVLNWAVRADLQGRR